MSNLTVTERGDELVIDFATPPRTTDGLAIREFENIDLRVGPNVTPFSFEGWSAGAKPYEVELPAASDRDDPQPKPLSLTIPVAEWKGQHVAIAVRTSVRKQDHFSAWSNRVVVDVLAPLEAPQLKAEGSAKGILLSWKANNGSRYEIFRQGPSDKSAVSVGSTGDPFFVDGSAQYGSLYRYYMIAREGAAQSMPSKTVTINAIDTFPPTVPASITALAGPDSIEISWQRSSEADLQGYYVYRSTNNAPFVRQGALVKVPTFTDKQVEHGKSYSYQVSAVDQKGNESAKSSATDIQF